MTHPVGFKPRLPRNTLSSLFSVSFEGRLFELPVFSFGDACAPEAYTFLTHMFRRALWGARIPHLRYIDDTLGPGAPDCQVRLAITSTHQFGWYLRLDNSTQADTQTRGAGVWLIANMYSCGYHPAGFFRSKGHFTCGK